MMMQAIAKLESIDPGSMNVAIYRDCSSLHPSLPADNFSIVAEKGPGSSPDNPVAIVLSSKSQQPTSPLPPINDDHER
jgi:hypothetical protein